MDFSLRKLAYIFNTRLKRLETLERRLKNFETLFRTSDLEFVVATPIRSRSVCCQTDVFESPQFKDVDSAETFRFWLVVARPTLGMECS